MLKTASKLLILAPALTYGLGAAFVAASYRLGAAPADPSSWKMFLTLAPIVREPVYFVSGLPGVSDNLTLILFAILALAGCAIAASAPRGGRAHFIYVHLALLMLLSSMGQAGVFTAGGDMNSLGPVSPLSWAPDFSSFPPSGVALFAAVFAACAVSHTLILRRMAGRSAMKRKIDAQLLVSLNQFA
jgi:hypothetical protein